MLSKNQSKPLQLSIKIIKASVTIKKSSGFRGIYVELDVDPSKLSSVSLKEETRRTPHSKSRRDPIWDYSCYPMFYSEGTKTNLIEIKLQSEYVPSRKSSNHVHGSKTIEVNELLEYQTSYSKFATVFREVEIQLIDETGVSSTSVVLQATIINSHYNIPKQLVWNEGTFLQATLCNPDLFQLPVSPVGLSGGTAAFYTLYLKTNKLSNSYFIGKDLSHAHNEVVFYEEIQALQKSSASTHTTEEASIIKLSQFFLEYAGVLVAPSISSTLSLNLLVLRNLYDGISKLRLVDVKIGEKTASSNWQGKSRTHAFRQLCFDRITNSTCEGFRLEGFESPPDCINSFLAKLDIHARVESVKNATKNAVQTLGNTMCKTDIMPSFNKFSIMPSSAEASSTDENPQKKSAIVKKSLKIIYQAMTGTGILMNLLDLNSNFPDSNMQLQLTTLEYSELVLHQVLKSLLSIAKLCHSIKLPQKWVGSSIAIGYDIHTLPLRSVSREEIQSSILVKLFDWGRSELNTEEKYAQMNDSEQNDRGLFWKYYIGGIDKLAYSALELYKNRFCLSNWEQVTFTVCDFLSPSDFYYGNVTVPLTKTLLTSLEIYNKDVATGTIEYSIEYIDYPTNSKFVGAWRIFLSQGHVFKKPGLNLSTPDAYCIVTCSYQNLSFDQVTRVEKNTHHPTWKQYFDVGLTKQTNELSALFLDTGIEWNDNLHYLSRLLDEKRSSSQYRILPTTSTISNNIYSRTESANTQIFVDILKS